MKRMSYRAVTMVLLFVAAAGAASAQCVVDFESFDLMGAEYLDTTETLVFNDVDGSGVTVMVTGNDDIRIYDLYLFGQDPSTTGQGMIDMNWVDYSNPAGTDIFFIPPVDSVYVVAGDFEGDDDSPIAITAYDSGDNVIATDSTPWGSGVGPPFAELHANAIGIARVHYLSGGSYMNSTFIDLIGFAATSPVDGTTWGRVKAQYR